MSRRWSFRLASVAKVGYMRSWGAPKIREKAFSSMAIALNRRVAATRRVHMLQLTLIDDWRSR